MFAFSRNIYIVLLIGVRLFFKLTKYLAISWSRFLSSSAIAACSSLAASDIFFSKSAASCFRLLIFGLGNSGLVDNFSSLMKVNLRRSYSRGGVRPWKRPASNGLGSMGSRLIKATSLRDGANDIGFSRKAVPNKDSFYV